MQHSCMLGVGLWRFVCAEGRTLKRLSVGSLEHIRHTEGQSVTYTPSVRALCLGSSSQKMS